MHSIESGVIRLSLEPGFGGRITKLTDLRTGRNWPVAFPQPDRPDLAGLPDLGRAHPLEAQFAAKLFTPVTGDFTACPGGNLGQIEIGWHEREISHVGLWLDHGGWPNDAPVRPICLAPTTAPFEKLSAALDGPSAANRVTQQGNVR